MIEKILEHLAFTYPPSLGKIVLFLYLPKLSLGIQFKKNDFYKRRLKTVCVIYNVSDECRIYNIWENLTRINNIS